MPPQSTYLVRVQLWSSSTTGTAQLNVRTIN
jgi:hypothetical protein